MTSVVGHARPQQYHFVVVQGILGTRKRGHYLVLVSRHLQVSHYVWELVLWCLLVSSNVLVVSEAESGLFCLECFKLSLLSRKLENRRFILRFFICRLVGV